MLVSPVALSCRTPAGIETAVEFVCTVCTWPAWAPRCAAGSTSGPKPAAFIIPANQHDPLTATKLVNKLLAQGVEIQQSAKGFTSGDVMYGPGSFVVSMAQPKMGVIRWLLGRTFYPDNSYTRDAAGNPIRPYDMSTDTMSEFMGVRVDPVDDAVTGDLVKLTAEIIPAGKVAKASSYVIDGRLNDSFKVVNLLLDKGVAVRRVDKPSDASLRAGDFIVSGGSDALVANVAKTTGVDFSALRGGASQGTHAVKRLRIGMYQRFYGGNMDENMLRRLGLDQRVIQQLIDEEAALVEARRQGITATDAEVLAAYIDGGLADDEVAAIDGHLSVCTACRALVARLSPVEAPAARAARPRPRAAAR